MLKFTRRLFKHHSTGFVDFGALETMADLRHRKPANAPTNGTGDEDVWKDMYATEVARRYLPVSTGDEYEGLRDYRHCDTDEDNPDRYEDLDADEFKSETEEEMYEGVTYNHPYRPPPEPKSVLDMPQFGVQYMPADGSCLFHCFKEAVNAAYPAMQVTVPTLRWVVSRRVTQDEYDTARVIYDMATKESDGVTLHEMDYMRPVSCLADYKLAFLRNSFWGNEQCIMHLRDFCGIQPIILKHDWAGDLSIGEGYRDESGQVFETDEERLYAIFELNGCHYNLVRFNGATVITKKQYAEVLAIDKLVRDANL
jgi:hypothetical protein